MSRWERLWVRLLVAQAVIGAMLGLAAAWYWAAIRTAQECLGR
jgi:flagellar biosynthesis protein FliR